MKRFAAPKNVCTATSIGNLKYQWLGRLFDASNWPGVVGKTVWSTIDWKNSLNLVVNHNLTNCCDILIINTCTNKIIL